MCSIGEDDFGDEGGIHAMPKDLKEPNKLSGNCSKCNANGTIFKLKFRDPECSSCFLAYARHKFRATLGSSKILPKGAEVLLLFNGSAESVVLLDMMHYAQEQNSFKRLHVETKILFIDESSINQSMKVSTVAQFLSKYDFESYCISLTNINSLTKIKDLNNFQLNCKASELPVNSIKTLTSRQDFLKISRNKAIEAAANKLKCNFVFSPDISTNLAMELINSIALGKGGSAALDVSLLDDRLSDLQLLRPLRNLNASEVELYLEVKNLKPLITLCFGEASGPNASIQNLTRRFIDDLQSNFSSTISTVFRTGDKIAPKVTNAQNSFNEMPKCTFCKSLLNDHVTSKTLQAFEFSRLASANSGEADNFRKKEKLPTNKINFPDTLCHACKNIQNDCKNVILPR